MYRTYFPLFLMGIVLLKRFSLSRQFYCAIIGSALEIDEKFLMLASFFAFGIVFLFDNYLRCRYTWIPGRGAMIAQIHEFSLRAL